MLTNSKIALSVALVLATASAAVALERAAGALHDYRGDDSHVVARIAMYEDTTQCFDRESCRRAAATARCVREYIPGAFGSASRRPARLNPWGHYIVPLAQRRLISQYCRRALAVESFDKLVGERTHHTRNFEV